MSDDLLFRTLSDAMERQEIVSIYTNFKEPDLFSAGRISKLTPTVTVLDSLAPDGRSDGICARLTEDIYKVERQGRYAAKLQFLQLSNTSPDAAQKAVREDRQEVTFQRILEIGRSMELVVSIWLSNDPDKYECRSGFLREIDGNQATMQVIGDFGEDDGFATVRVSDIKSINLGGVDETELALLYRNAVKLR